MTTSIVLTGLDGSNPLGFLAALGTLAAAEEGAPGARLSWRNEGRWRPVLISSFDRASLVARLVADLSTWQHDPAIALSYAKVVKDPSKKKAGEPKFAHDLKPTIERFRDYLGDLGRQARSTGSLARYLSGPRRPLDYAAAFGTDIARDGNGNVKPTALHFTAGQQEFLKGILELVDPTDGVNAADLEEALFGPWTYTRELAVQSWDATASRDYALRADDPSKSKKAGVPGADWLGFRGLAFVPVAPRGTEILTAGCSGGWKVGGAFSWPLWSGSLSIDAVRAIMTFAGLARLDAHARRARGVEVLFRSGIKRSDQGGYGAFLPSDVVPPKAAST